MKGFLDKLSLLLVLSNPQGAVKGLAAIFGIIAAALVVTAVCFANSPVGKFAIKVGQLIWQYGPTVALVLLGIVAVWSVLSFFDRF